jgi:hypothetical protein
MAEKVVLFSSIFGMEPATFITVSRCIVSEINPTNSQALALEVSSYLQDVLLDSNIFGLWMMHIKVMYLI